MSATATSSGVGRSAWFFLAPALILIFVFFFLPVLASLVLSNASTRSLRSQSLTPFRRASFRACCVKWLFVTTIAPSAP